MTNSSGAKKSKKLVLLIGNDYYDQKSGRLCTSIQNTTELREILQKIGFDVLEATDTKELDLKENLRSFVEKLNSYDIALLYYAGHACHVAEKNYLIPIDDERIKKYGDIPDRSGDFHGLIDRIEMQKSNCAVILILDTPHRYAPEARPTTASTTTGPGLLNMKAPRRTIIQYACAIQETVSDNNGIDSKQLFHKHLLENIKQPNLDIFDLLTFTNNAVKRDSQGRQCPVTIREENDYPEVIINEHKMPDLSNIPHDANWSPNGVTVAGGFGSGPTKTRLNTPRGFYVTNRQDTVISDTNNHRIMKFNSIDIMGKCLFGNTTGAYLSDRLYRPSDVMYDNSTKQIIVSDTHNREVVCIEGDFTKSEIPIMDNIYCRGIAFGKDGCIYVCDAERHEVRRFGRQCGANGILVAGGNGQGNRLHQLNYPSYVCIGPNEAVYISDSWNNRVIRWDPDAQKGVIVAGGRGVGKNLDQLHNPTGLYVDKSGTVYVADYWNHRIMRWHKNAESGEILVGNRYVGGSEPDCLNLPEGLAFDRFGHMYVADSNNHRIQRFHIRTSSQSDD